MNEEFDLVGEASKHLDKIKYELSPAELYERLLAQKSRARKLKGLEKDLGITYGYLKNFMSAMGKLDPEVREKLQWGGKHRNEKLTGRIGVREAFILSRVGRDEQKVLADSLLSGNISSFDQLVAAVSMVKDGMPAESAVKSVSFNLANKKGRAAAGFVSFIYLLRHGFVAPSLLERAGINKRSAQRAVKDLQEAGILDGYFLSTRMKKMIQKLLSKNSINVLSLIADLSGLLVADDDTFEKAIAVLRKRQKYLKSHEGIMPAA